MKEPLQLVPLILYFLIPYFISAQDEKVSIKVDTLSRDVYMLTGEGGNIGIYVGEAYVFMIDDQFDRISEENKAAIRTISDKPIAFLFNTHMHGDHSGGNASFNTERTTLVSQTNARKRIDLQNQQELQEGKIDAQFYKKMLPEVTFSEDITFYDGEETIMGLHVHHAHTDGDALIYFPYNNVIHMGDTYFAGRYPFIDLESGGSIDGYIAAIQKALMLINDDTAIIPGHGRPSNKAEMQTYLAMLQDIRGRVQAAVDAGISLEDAKAMESLTEGYDESYGGGFINPERMRETIYTSLTSPPEADTSP